MTDRPTRLIFWSAYNHCWPKQFVPWNVRGAEISHSSSFFQSPLLNTTLHFYESSNFTPITESSKLRHSLIWPSVAESPVSGTEWARRYGRPLDKTTGCFFSTLRLEPFRHEYFVRTSPASRSSGSPPEIGGLPPGNFHGRIFSSFGKVCCCMNLKTSSATLTRSAALIENLLKILYSYNHCRHSGVSWGSLNCLAWVANTWTDLTLGSPSACNSLLGWGAGSIFLFPETFRTWWTAGWGNIGTLRHKVSRVLCRIKGQLHDFSDKMNFPNSVSPHKQL